jgi:hypothetical protein
MPLKILRAEEPIEVKTVNILIYGMPGAGKTSTAFTAATPLLLDFDKGAHRSMNRKDIVQINNWSEVSKLSPADLKPYNTIIIDTLGRCLDYIQQALIESDAKLGKKDGGLTMTGWGALKSHFTNWMKQLSLLGKDVILIAHDREDKDGDVKFIRPDIVGGSYNEVMKVADFIGYLYLINDKRQLDFNPCEKFIGKNAAGFPKLNIPDFGAEPAYMGKMMKKMKDSLGQISKEQSEAVGILNQHIERINAMTTADQINAYLYEKKPADLKNGIVEQLKAHTKARAKELGLEFHTEEKKYFEIPKAKPEPAPILEADPFPEPEEEPVQEEAAVADTVDEFAQMIG